MSANVDPDPYVERNVTVASMVEWLHEPNPKTRLCSIVGPPGCGKTTFVKRLHATLHNTPAPQCCISFLSLERQGGPREATHNTNPDPPPPRPEAICVEWLSDTVAKAPELFPNFTLAPGTEELSKQMHDFVRALCGSVNCQPPPLLLVDAYDELEVNSRNWIEQEVLYPFLFPLNVSNPNTRIIIARRDPYGLEALKWEDRVLALDPLNSPEQTKQIEQRLEYMLQPEQPIDWAQVPPGAKAALQRLGESGIVSFVELLRESLTPNPFINVLLLERQLEKLNVPLTSGDYKACLAAFVERAGLEPQYIELLSDNIRQVDYKPFPAVRSIGSQEDKGRLIEKGIVSQIPDTPRLQFEGAVVHLVKKMDEDAAQGEEPQ